MVGPSQSPSQNILASICLYFPRTEVNGDLLEHFVEVPHSISFPLREVVLTFFSFKLGTLLSNETICRNFQYIKQIKWELVQLKLHREAPNATQVASPSFTTHVLPISKPISPVSGAKIVNDLKCKGNYYHLWNPIFQILGDFWLPFISTFYCLKIPRVLTLESQYLELYNIQWYRIATDS